MQPASHPPNLQLRLDFRKIGFVPALFSEPAKIAPLAAAPQRSRLHIAVSRVFSATLESGRKRIRVAPFIFTAVEREYPKTYNHLSQGRFTDVIDNTAIYSATCLPNNYNEAFTQEFSAPIRKHGLQTDDQPCRSGSRVDREFQPGG
jgi:hypothetical protein